MNALQPCPHEVFLQPGQFWFGSGEVRLRTVLGSRVAATFWHRQRRLGGLVHLPPAGTASTDSDQDQALSLLDRLQSAMHDQSTGMAEYEVRLYCGGRVFAAPADFGRDGEEQRRQLRHAETLLRACGAQPVAGNAASQGRRQLLFDVADGELQLQPWPKVETLVRRVQVNS